MKWKCEKCGREIIARKKIPCPACRLNPPKTIKSPLNKMVDPGDVKTK